MNEQKNQKGVPASNIKITPPKPREYVIEVDISRANFTMFVKQFFFELFRPLVMAFLLTRSFVMKRKVGVFKITNIAKYDGG